MAMTPRPRTRVPKIQRESRPEPLLSEEGAAGQSVLEPEPPCRLLFVCIDDAA